jgi:endonuclease/exonuclease/phosphatase family metal-dependent hydrolase
MLRLHSLRTVLVPLLLVTGACSGQRAGSAAPDAGPPSAPLDGGRPDSGHAEAGVPDAGLVDAGSVDAGPVDAGPVDAGQPDSGEPDAGVPDAGLPDAGVADAGDLDAGPLDVDAGPSVLVRLMAANLSSGTAQSYDPGEGIRIFQGLHPDVAMIQEFNFGDGSDAAIRSFVDTAFGTGFSYYRGTGSIPNGVISRFPILASGEWVDPAQATPNRAFTWAHVDLPGPRDLWVISLHLLTKSSPVRDQEAQALVTDIQTDIPAGDFIALGGDLNTSSLSESALLTLGQVVVTASNPPVDQAGDSDTNSPRSHPYDHVYLSPALAPLAVPVAIGPALFPDGLVFDSRVYTPLADVAPVLLTDSGANGMQHMAVLRDVLVPY